MMIKHKRAVEFKESFVKMNCQVCGKPMKAATTLRKYCFECREKRKRMWTESYYVRRNRGESKNGRLDK